MAPHPTVDELAVIPLFSKLDREQLGIIAPFLSTELYPAGKNIVQEGTAGYVFFLIHDGQVDVTQNGQWLRALQPGDFFGEIAILGDNGKRTATVTARSDVTTWVMFGTNFRELQARHAEVASALKD